MTGTTSRPAGLRQLTVTRSGVGHVCEFSTEHYWAVFGVHATD